ncbi:MAG: T9SS type A sorting domain-containing protein [Taibaiella sp.]|nr:T9SS type A sorting domain-containing protein [Taibaiella sp.]
MKKQILLSIAAAGMTGLMIMSNSAGPATSTGGNRTGAKGSTANCSTSGCHGTTSGVSARIWIDSAGTPVTQYTAGKTYNIKVVGQHASLTKWGFQFAAVSGTGSAQVQAGTFSGVSLPIANHTLSGLNIIEQSSVITAVSPADTFVKSFTWTAPASGVGNITLYLTVNAVNGNGSDDAGDGSANITKTLTLYTPPSSAVGTVNTDLTVTAYPNPVSGSSLNLRLGNNYGTYSISVYDVTGRLVSSESISSTVNGNATISTANWTPGLYKVAVANENSSQVISVVKQ